MYFPVCLDPPAVANAEVSSGTVTVYSLRTYSCVAGKDLIGDPTVTCLGDLTWSEPSLICDGKYVLHYPYNILKYKRLVIDPIWQQISFNVNYMFTGSTFRVVIFPYFCQVI
jgi:hypothetical protein